MSEQLNKVCVNLAQDFTNDQKAQARANIGAASTAAATQSAAGLMSSADKVKLDGLQPQVQSDWNEADSSDPAYIQNKPAIPEGVPAYSTSDTGKSLTVVENDGVAGLSWERRISGVMYNGSTGIEMRRLRVNSYNDPNTPGLVAAFPVTGQGVSCGVLMPDPDGVDMVARVIDNPQNPGIGMLAYQNDAAVITSLEKVSISTSTNPYQIDAQHGKWYEIVCSQSTAQTWHIYLEAASSTAETVHTIVRITRSDSSISCSPELVWHDERGVIHYEQCDLTGATSYYDYDVLVRRGFHVSGTPWSFARVRRL